MVQWFKLQRHHMLGTYRRRTLEPDLLTTQQFPQYGTNKVQIIIITIIIIIKKHTYRTNITLSWTNLLDSKTVKHYFFCCKRQTPAPDQNKLGSKVRSVTKLLNKNNKSQNIFLLCTQTFCCVQSTICLRVICILIQQEWTNNDTKLKEVWDSIKIKLVNV